MVNTDYGDSIIKYKEAVNKYNDLHDKKDYTSQLNELSKEMSKEYYLFVIWLIISIIVIILTSITVVYKSEINPLVWIISIIFIIYCSFFIFKNIYNLYVFG